MILGSIRSEGSRSSDAQQALPFASIGYRRSGPHSGRNERNASRAGRPTRCRARRRENKEPPCFHVQPLRPSQDAQVPCAACVGAACSRTGPIAGRTAAPASSTSTRRPASPRAPFADTRPGRTEPSGVAYSGATISIGSPNFENSKFVVPLTSTPVGSVAEKAVFARTGVPSSSIQMSNTSY
jgi:hypothetical protein